MYKIEFGKSGIQVPTVAVGCMRMVNMDKKHVDEFIDTALQNDANFLTTQIFTAAV